MTKYAKGINWEARARGNEGGLPHRAPQDASQYLQYNQRLHRVRIVQEKTLVVA